ncbi:MAG TPA: GDP-mannose 4,6-dehydratase [Micromonosporaceae bacterium]
MKILITGVTGFAGSYLAEYLVDKADVEVYGLKRWNSPLTDISSVMDQITLINFDLGDPHAVYQAVKEVQPDRIFHLAAQSYVPMSFRAPVDTIRANALGTVALLEAVREIGIDPVIHICTSSEVYGEVPPEELPIVEETRFRPQSPYGVSKVAEDMIGYQYHQSYGMRILRTRSFTHTGPRSKEVFVAPAFAKQIAEAEAGLQKPVIRVGNRDSIRTFLDIRDMVEAYWLLTEHCPPGEVYNVAGTHTCTIGEMLELLLGMTDVRPEVMVDPQLLRPSDVTRQIPDTTKFREATGWEPKIPFEQTLLDILEYWRDQVRQRRLAVVR